MNIVSYFGLPAALINIISILTGIIGGGLYVISLFHRTRNAATQQDISSAKDASEFVIGALEEKIKILEGKVLETTNNLIATNIRLDGIQKENDTLRNVLLGQDPEQLIYRQKGLQAFQTADEVLTIVQSNNAQMKDLYRLIERLVGAIEKQTKVTVTTG